MYHCFLIHSSDDGHLGCFHVLAIIALLQRIFLTQGLNLRLCLSHLLHWQESSFTPSITWEACVCVCVCVCVWCVCV